MIVDMEYKVVVAPTSTLEEAIQFANEHGEIGSICLEIPPSLKEKLKDVTEWPHIYTETNPQVIGD